VGGRAVQACSLSGKLDVAQEALFWGQFSAAGFVLVESLFGDGAFNAGIDLSVKATRHINVFKAPDKIKEAQVSLSFKANGDKSLDFELKREDDFKIGASLDLNNPANSSVSVGAGFLSVGFATGDPTGSDLGFKKSIDIFKITKCKIDILEGKLKLGAKLSLSVFKPSAAIGLEAIAGLLSLEIPLIPE
jgi:hypothetical protein